MEVAEHNVRMNHRRLIAPAAIAAALVLSGCASFPNVEQAYQECQDKITPQFDDPASVTWPDDGYSASGSGDTRIIIAVVEEGDKRTRVDCFITQTADGWELSRYDFSDPTDEVVN